VHVVLFSKERALLCFTGKMSLSLDERHAKNGMSLIRCGMRWN